MNKHLLKAGNHKLSKQIGIWTLPRVTCIGKGKCESYCYAKIFENMPDVSKYRNNRLNISKSRYFEFMMKKELSTSQYKKIRFHECGDFYNQTYLDKCKRIASEFPEVIFLAYTKSLKLDLWSNLPKNFIIFQSYDGKYDNLIDVNKNTARVINSVTDKKENEYLCKYGESTFKKCGETCNYCYNKSKVKHVAFMLHRKSKR